MKKFVSSFEEACQQLGKSTELPDVSQWPERLQKHLIATYKLDTILEVNNDGWKANIADTDQYKYYPWFSVEPNESRPSGFALACDGYGCDLTISNLGARLACKDEELAQFMGENCAALYEELHA